MKYRALLTLLTVALLAIFGWSKLNTTVKAGINQWTSKGPTGGDIACLVIDPVTHSTMYAGVASGGVYKSTDSGATWSAIDSGLPSPAPALSIAIDPIVPSTVYLSTSNNGLFKTTDGGLNWFPINNGLNSDPSIRVLVVDPTSPNTLYAGEGVSQGVYKSTDGGATWTASSSGLGNNSRFVFSLAIDPSNDSTIYLGNLTIYKSTDGGTTWVPSNGGLPIGDVRQIVVNPVTPNVVYAATDTGIFQSTDTGASWTSISTGLPYPYSYLRSVALVPGWPDTLYAGSYYGMFKSSNGGQSWNLVGLDGSSVQVITIDPANPARVYAGAGESTLPNGLFVTSDAGASWQLSEAGINGTFIEALAVSPSMPSTIYAGARLGGISKSTDKGQSWLPVNTGLPATGRVFALAVAGSTPQPRVRHCLSM